MKSEREQRRLHEKDSIAIYQYNITKDCLVEYHAERADVFQIAVGSSSQAILKQLYESIPIEEDLRKLEEFFNNENNYGLFQNGETDRSMEYRILASDGRIHWRRITAHFSRDVASSDIISYTYIRDIDFQRKKELAAEALVEEETDYVILLDVMADACRVLRMKEELVIDNTWKIDEKTDFSILVQPDKMKSIFEADRENVLQFFDRTTLIQGLKTQSVITVTFRQISKDNEIRRKKIRAFYLDDTRQDIIIARRDITDLYEEEQEQKHILQEALDQAKQASHAKSTFLSNMSHEIRTPINAIIGLTELAQDEATNPSMKESLTSIQNSSKYLLNIINDILDMSRIESGKFTLDREWVLPMNVLMPCIDMIRPVAEAKHITFNTPDFSKILAYEYYVDVLKTQRMLMNVLNNACKFTGEGGEISIGFKNQSHDQGVAVDQVTIEDTGCGMSEEFLTHVFEPFAQEHNVYAGTSLGTGLGMPLARQTALAMGGDIKVESKLGFGSKFTITFPYQYRICEKKPEAMAKKKSDITVLKGTRILLCEDNELNTMIAKNLLEKVGCIVDCAENGKVGLERFKASTPGTYQGVLMDIRMPIMDGLQATKAIRNLDKTDAKSVPIIAMSANAFEEDIKTSLAAGMNQHLAKPVEPQKMYAVLADEIEKLVLLS